MEKKISLFHHVSCVMRFDSALSVVAVIVVSGMVALESFGASPAGRSISSTGMKPTRRRRGKPRHNTTRKKPPSTDAARLALIA